MSWPGSMKSDLSAIAVLAESWVFGVYSLYWILSLIVIWIGARFFIRTWGCHHQ